MLTVVYFLHHCFGQETHNNMVRNIAPCSSPPQHVIITTYQVAWVAPDFFSWGGQGAAQRGQILAMEGLLMNASTITGGGGKARARKGGASGPARPDIVQL